MKIEKNHDAEMDVESTDGWYDPTLFHLERMFIINNYFIISIASRQRPKLLVDHHQ